MEVARGGECGARMSNHPIFWSLVSWVREHSGSVGLWRELACEWKGIISVPNFGSEAVSVGLRGL